MIAINDDDLTFTFPEIASQVRELFEKHVQSTLRNLLLPADRAELVKGLRASLRQRHATWELRSDDEDTYEAPIGTKPDGTRILSLGSPWDDPDEAPGRSAMVM
jgi:hypothetical protein